jgi:hypothetical protein
MNVEKLEPLHSPPAHDAGSLRVRVCESEISRYVARFPHLDRGTVMRVIVDFGPWRSNVEAQLGKLSFPGDGSR